MRFSSVASENRHCSQPCEFWGLFPLIHSGGSFPQPWAASHACTNECSAEYSRRTLSGSLVSTGLHCEFYHLGFPELLQLHWLHLPAPQREDCLQAAKLGSHRAHLLHSHLSESTALVLPEVQHLENCCFIDFISLFFLGFFFSGRKVNIVPFTPSWLKAGFHIIHLEK